MKSSAAERSASTSSGSLNCCGWPASGRQGSIWPRGRPERPGIERLLSAQGPSYCRACRRQAACFWRLEQEKSAKTPNRANRANTANGAFGSPPEYLAVAPPASQVRMRAVAERGGMRLLAPAQRHSTGLVEHKLQRVEARSFMRAIAKRLTLRPPAPTPPVFPCCQVQHDRFFRRDDRFRHLDSPFLFAWLSIP